jgi:hypothetical protein
MTLEIIEVYLWGFLGALNWIFTWQTTTLKVKFLKLWIFLRRKKVMLYTPTDFEEYVYKNWGLLGELLTCPICFSHWVGAIFSGVLAYVLNVNYIVVPLAFFSYPVLIYFLIKKYI